jgi:hypothetical protein
VSRQSLDAPATLRKGLHARPTPDQDFV